MSEPGPTRTVHLQLKEWSDGPVGPAEAQVGHLSLGRRLRRGAIPVLLAVLGALILLPVPLMHLAGIPLLGLGGYLGVRNLRAHLVFFHASGTCPSCGGQTTLFVGFGRPPFKLPVATSCSACGRSLTLERVPE